MAKFKKVTPIISEKEFIKRAKEVKKFLSVPKGKRYEVEAVNGNTMSFVRLDTDKKWEMDLSGLHKAYIKLDEADFSNTKNFSPYVKRTHSPSRGLLIHLGLIEEIKP